MYENTRKTRICLDFRLLSNATRSAVRLYHEWIAGRCVASLKTFLKEPISADVDVLERP
jgi:hypothetical protein